MIALAGNFRILLAAQPIDFRKRMDGLAADVSHSFDLYPISGAIYIFRSCRTDRLQLLVWGGTGLVLVTKRLDGKRFVWPKTQVGPLVLSKVQFNALFEGIDWRAVALVTARKPSLI